MRIAKYRKNIDGKYFEVEYDEEAPCQCCGEPVISASMGGTNLCPACDLGKCRYCGKTIFVIRKEIDGGKSKEELLKHMKWHHEHDAKCVKEINDSNRKFNEAFDKKIKEEENGKRNKS